VLNISPVGSSLTGIDFWLNQLSSGNERAYVKPSILYTKIMTP